jgi:hypothetical protein
MNVEVSHDDGASWDPLNCGWNHARNGEFLKGEILGIPPKAALSMSDWMEAAARLQHRDVPDVALICLTNGLESERVGDTRHAVLEVVIALETVVTRIVDYYWTKRVPKNEIRSSSGVGLSYKLFLALPLAVGVFWTLCKDDAELALASIHDRNEIAHRGVLAKERLADPRFWDSLKATGLLVRRLLDHEDLLKKHIDHLGAESPSPG